MGNLRDISRARNHSWGVKIVEASSTVVSISAKPCVIGGWAMFNDNSNAIFLQFFDKALPADVTLGTTVPFMSLGFPPTSAANQEFSLGVLFPDFGCQVAATTTYNGLTNPTNPVTLNIFMK